MELAIQLFPDRRALWKAMDHVELAAREEQIMDSPLDQKTGELVALAATVAGHCPECFVRHFRQALHLDVPIEQIKAAIELAQTARSLSNQGMDTQILQCLAAVPAILNEETPNRVEPEKKEAR